MSVPDELMAILQCPECRGKVLDEDKAIVCTRCGLHYPVRDGIPFMVTEEAYRPEQPGGAT